MRSADHGEPHTNTHKPRLFREAVLPRTARKWAALLLSASLVGALGGIAASALGILWAGSPSQQSVPTTVHIVATDDAKPGGAPPAGPDSQAIEPAELPPGAEASLVHAIGDEIFAIAGDAPSAVVAATDFELVGDARHPEGAIGALDADSLPAEIEELAAWPGSPVRVNGECEAEAADLAVVLASAGSVDYMPIDSWQDPDASEVLDVLVESVPAAVGVRLEGCKDALRSAPNTAEAAPNVARHADLAPAAEAEIVRDPALERRAQADLLASEASQRVQDYRSGAREQVAPWWEVPSAEVGADILRNPQTGEELVSAWARAHEGCGRASAHLWALYEVKSGGELERIALHELDPASALHGAYVFGESGELSWLKSRPFGGAALLGHDADPRAEADVAFFGCRC